MNVATPPAPPNVLHRCDQFVGRTTNWLYDHLRLVPRFTPSVLCDSLANRQEFPEINAWRRESESVSRRVWRRLSRRPYPPDARRLRALAPIALHSHFGYVAVDDCDLAEFLDVPWFVSFYGADVYQLGLLPEWREKYGHLFARAALVLALGPFMANHLEKLGCPREKIRVHTLGVDVQSLPVRPRVWSPGRPLRLLFAGTFREKKGIRYIIESAALARKRGVELEVHLVGDAAGKSGDLEVKREVFQEIRRLNLENVVTSYGYLPFKDLVALALECHVFVAPSVTAADGDREGTPFVLQQMMATGMAALATVHSDIPFLFGDLQPLLVPERDALTLADRLVGYAERPDAIVRDGMALRGQIARHFDARREAAPHLAELYDEFAVTGARAHGPRAGRRRSS
jgi:colanic acid/amylovoran/stewartan biosynthesis glycosyltransferase WcaL/AmsK/CpsK